MGPISLDTIPLPQPPDYPTTAPPAPQITKTLPAQGHPPSAGSVARRSPTGTDAAVNWLIMRLGRRAALSIPWVSCL